MDQMDQMEQSIQEGDFDSVSVQAIKADIDSLSPMTAGSSYHKNCDIRDLAEEAGGQDSWSCPISNDISLNENISSEEEVPDEEDDDEDDSKDESMDSDSDVPLDDIDNMLEEGFETHPTTSDGNKRKRKLDEMRLKLSTPHEERKKIVLKSMRP